MKCQAAIFSSLIIAGKRVKEHTECPSIKTTILIHLAASAFYNEDPCRSEGYYCTPSVGGYCPGDTYLEGACPTQPSDIKCCTSLPFDETECTAAGGNCLDDRMRHGGDQAAGLCPSQPDGVRCCICK